MAPRNPTNFSRKPCHALSKRFLQPIVEVINNVYSCTVKSAEFKRWLAKQGVTFRRQKGSHLKLFLNGRHSILPVHPKELGKGLVETIKNQLGLKDRENLDQGN